MLFFAIGAVFVTVGVLGSKTTITWLRRASDVVARTRPAPVRVTFRIEDTYSGRRSGAMKLFASLQPDGQNTGAPATATPGIPPIANIPLMTGMQSSRSRYTVYQDTPAQVHLDRTTDGPIVININGEYWCSNPGFKHPVRRG
ncbi:MAG: hypothetical protein ACYDBB_26155 [Armatimonadota bacterium]